MSERCLICGLLGHNDERLPAEVLRQALQRHAIYEGATPKLLAALEETARARHECAVVIDREWGAVPAERHDAHEFEGCHQAACVEVREIIKEARGT